MAFSLRGAFQTEEGGAKFPKAIEKEEPHSKRAWEKRGQSGNWWKRVWYIIVCCIMLG